ncbi:MAG: hypothetical protein VB035_03785 [Candidatus Fimivivens sp.]|nr:hypothetical protein [Candidatus Fimivivens sp.]
MPCAPAAARLTPTPSPAPTGAWASPLNPLRGLTAYGLLVAVAPREYIATPPSLERHSHKTQRNVRAFQVGLASQERGGASITPPRWAKP